MWRAGLNATFEYDKDGVVSVESWFYMLHLNVKVEV